LQAIGRQKTRNEALIYPAGEKSITTYPFYDLYYRFREHLKGDFRALALGFSFRDLAIRNIFVDWLRRTPKAKLLVYARSARSREELFPSDVRSRVLLKDVDFNSPTWLAGFAEDLL
jgi:hypothetical protein